MEQQYIRVRVSDLKYWVICGRRVRIQLQNKYTPEANIKTKSMNAGTEFHNKEIRQNQYPWNLELFLYKLWDKVDGNGKYSGTDTFHTTFLKRIGPYEVRGIPDGYVLHNKEVSIVETKTSYPSIYDIKISTAQLLLYCWLMEPYIKDLGYTLSNTHYLRYWDRDKNVLRKEITLSPTLADKDVLRILDSIFEGTSSYRIPEDYETCKSCPRWIHSKCRRNR